MQNKPLKCFKILKIMPNEWNYEIFVVFEHIFDENFSEPSCERSKMVIRYRSENTKMRNDRFY